MHCDPPATRAAAGAPGRGLGQRGRQDPRVLGLLQEEVGLGGDLVPFIRVM